MVAGRAPRARSAIASAQAQPIPRDREDRLFEALGRLEENHRVELAANEAYERWRATARDTMGRVLKGNSKPYVAPELPEGTINLSDPDSRVMRTQGTPPRQAYNAQTAVNDQQIILAAEITLDAPDFGHLEPMLDTHRSSARAAWRERAARRRCSLTPATGTPPRSQAISERGIEVLIPPDGNMREGKRPGWEHGLYERMRRQAHQRATAASSTRNARSRSSRSTGRSNTTGASTGSCEEAEPPRSRSGG